MQKIERRRVFLFEDLPIKRSSEHLQFFDNYIENTNLRIRTIRSPKTKLWEYILEKRVPISENDFSKWYVSQISLDEAEHAIFEQFENVELGNKMGRVFTNELRFNRYFYEYNAMLLYLDVFLWPLWGLNMLKAFFDSDQDMENFKAPDFAILEVTQVSFFTGKNLVGKTIEDVKQQVEKLTRNS
ncbi:MAG: hypothetical protein N2Z23_06480 [Pyrinomonadaceae bacterium]|nr:hypothetical protein [Pyrinomonadaceae bacterium]MCX7640068.1 hypothetical protein [Pyrinomonadaceae bacterium]MDW8304240.1 hypothetical protein [Acidobacteriota bacterium]